MRTLTALLLMTLIGVSLAGCASFDKKGCDGFKPIYITQTDALTMDPETKKQIVAHNEYGEKRCKWKAAR